MAKYENSVYYKIWNSSEGREITTTILQDPNLVRANHTFWREDFLVDPKITPTNDMGEAVFIQYMRKAQTGGLADLRAPLGDSVPAEKGNAAYYTGVIPDFITKGYVEKATERWYRDRVIDQFEDKNLIAAYANDFLQPALDTVNQTLSNMAAQLLSKGKIYYDFGHGADAPLLKADIPAENFLGAGEIVWSDTANCMIIDQVRKIYEDIRNRLGVDLQMQLQITRKQWNENWLHNNQVIEYVRYFGSLNNTLLPEVFDPTSEMAMNAISKIEGMPKIVIVDESQYDSYNNTTVHGWNDTVAVMRPVGYAGYIRRTEILDEKLYKEYGSKLIERNFSSAMGGIATIMNSVINNGNLKEWHSDCMFSAIPSLDEFLHHYIIDTTTISSSTF